MKDIVSTSVHVFGIISLLCVHCRNSRRILLSCLVYYPPHRHSRGHRTMHSVYCTHYIIILRPSRDVYNWMLCRLYYGVVYILLQDLKYYKCQIYMIRVYASFIELYALRIAVDILLRHPRFRVFPFFTLFGY